MDSVAAAGEAALVFTGYVSMGHLIQAHLLARGMPAEFLHGGTPAAKRQEIVDRFQSGHGVALICLGPRGWNRAEPDPGRPRDPL